jgi:hypothetical protein
MGAQMPFCPNCGKEAPEEAVFCERCGEKIPDLRSEGVGVEWTPHRRGLANHLRAALSLLREKPIVFVPEVVGAIVSMALSRIWGVVGRPTGMLDLWDDYLNPDWGVITVANGYLDAPPEFWSTLFQYMVGGFLFLIVLDMVSKLFTFATIDMARDAYLENDVGLGRTAGYVRSRLGLFLVAGVVSLLIQFTFVLIPLSILFFVVLVVEDTGIRAALSKGFRLGIDNFGTVTGLIILWIVSFLLFSMIPYVSEVARAIPGVVLYVALIDLYYQSDR